MWASLSIMSLGVLMKSNKRYAVILSGGSGTRLWPLSRTFRPKQLLSLNGELTMLQQTVKRLTLFVNPSRLYVVTNEEHQFEVKGQLADLYPESIVNVLVEPYAKNTLPAIALATHFIHQKDPNAMIGIFASDQAIDDDADFLKAWQAAEQAAEQGYLTLIGVKPDEPATGYGYIKPSQTKLKNTVQEIFEVENFVEKPNFQKAKHFLSEGYLWNTGIFIFKSYHFLEMLHQYQPKIHEQMITLNHQNLAEKYINLPRLSMDYGLAEKAEKVAVVPVNMIWSDLGSWDSIYARNAKDSYNNVTYGETLNLDTQDSLIWSESAFVATLGLKNILVIQTSDAILVCDRTRAEDIKNLVSLIKAQKPEITNTHQTVWRPWGSYTVLEEHPNFKIKRIVVNPGASLSLQIHQHRSEHWVVVSGVATITNNDIEYTLKENESTYIPKNNLHRLANNNVEPLSIIEVQCGDYVGEDDIVRFDDRYGRVEEK
jgi:mannose-1-phosphate guanylyltransferase/mannose-6-phosphate isomerase